MSAEAHFCCRQNSHPFQERRVVLTEPAKIGRSVAKCRPAPNNAVFDCKVLSRNHAVIWYDNGKFYLQDTKSSNGTFINNQRLSRTSEESSAVEVNSCDIVQFGVDVVDTTKKVTHGCIVSQLRLYLPNGEESKQTERSPSGTIEKVPSNSLTPNVQYEDLYQLQQYIQEALHREQMLEQKLASLQRHVDDSQVASVNGWQALIDEDKLLTRLEFLENQVKLYKNQDEASLHAKVHQLEDEKFNYENTSKETLRQAVKEKLEAAQKVASLEFLVGNLEDECTHYKMSQEDAQRQLKELSGKHQTKLKALDELKENVKEMESKTQELQNKLDTLSKQKQDSEEQLIEKNKEIENKFFLLQADYEDIKNQNLKNTLLAESRTEIGVQVDGEKLHSSDFYLNLTDAAKAAATVDSNVDQVASADKHCQDCRKKFPPLSSHSPPSSTSATVQQNLPVDLVNKSADSSAPTHNDAGDQEINKSNPTESSAPTDSAAAESSPNPLRENGLPPTSNADESRDSAAQLDQLLAEENRLQIKLNAIRSQIDSHHHHHQDLLLSLPPTETASDSTVTVISATASNDSLPASAVPKNKGVKKSSSLMLKMPSVKFGKKSSKKKAVLSESDADLSSLTDNVDIQKELTACKEQLDAKNAQVLKLEKDLSTIQENAKAFTDLRLKVEQLEDENKELGEVREDLRKTKDEFVAISQQHTAIQAELTKREAACAESERKISELCEKLTAQTLLVDQHSSREAQLQHECQQLTAKYNELSDQRALLNTQMEELERLRLETQNLFEKEKARSRELQENLNRCTEQWKKESKELKRALVEAKAQCQIENADAQSDKALTTWQTMIGLIIFVLSFVVYFIMEHQSV